MSFLTHKRAIEAVNSPLKGRKPRKRSTKIERFDPTNRRCRVEELEKREYLAADPISVGVVYAEQGVENLGDKFYVAWVGGEDGSTTLDSLTINLDKNGNGSLDDGEAFFDVQAGGAGVYSSVPFTLVDKTADIGYSYQVEDGGMTLAISFTNFHAGDSFIFSIDLDEHQTAESDNNNAIVEGGEMGGSVVKGIAGSKVEATFSSERYQTEEWAAQFVDNYDGEYVRSAALSDAYDAEKLPFDLDDDNEGIWNAGVYDTFELTPKPIVVSGYVYGDLDMDCELDPTDERLANVELTLIAEDGRTWTTTTDANGYYEFNDEQILPGFYQIVSQSVSENPEYSSYFDFCAKGGEFGTKVSELEIDVSGMQGGDVAPDNNFAKAQIGTIDGYVFEDRNNKDNRQPELGEGWDETAYPAQVELWRVDADENGVVTKTLMETQTVGEDGYYKFVLDGSWNADHSLRKLVEKNYEIREIFDSADYSDGKDYVGTLGGKTVNDAFEDVYVGYGQHGYDYNFGELKLGSIAGNVYEDRNDNGVQDPGEAGIAGVTVELYKWDGSDYVKIDETTTDENGEYLFEDLDIICDYAVKEKQPTDYDNGQTAVGTLGGVKGDDYVSEIEVGWDQHGEKYDFGELKLGSIEGNVYEDRNDNGVQDPGEAGIAGVTVELYQWDGFDYVKVDETTTAEDGTYKFDKLDINKEYAVREKQPEDYDQGKNAVGSLGGELGAQDEIRAIPVQWDDRGVEYNFGELKLGSVSGFVYEDYNDNGIKEEGEAGIPNAKVELYQLQSDGTYSLIATTTTDENGAYKFDKLDINREYGVREYTPEEYADGKDAVGSLGGRIVSNDEIREIPVQWDDQGTDYNFGELKLGLISGYVYEDYNDNGVKETGEKGIAGTKVELYRWVDGEYVYETETTTDENGFYEFKNLAIEQKYGVREYQPEDYTDGKDAIGTLGGQIVDNDYMNEINVHWFDKGENYNFGELKLGSLSGYVYHDRNDNGLREPLLNEEGIGGVTVELYRLQDGEYVYVSQTKTDEDGFYKFDSLDIEQTYAVKEIQPEDWKDGKDAVGYIDGVQVGRLADNDFIDSVRVYWDAHGVEYDYGERLFSGSLSGYVYEDNNDNGLREENLGEAGIAGVKIDLYVVGDDGTASFVATQTTDKTGFYKFDDLDAEKTYIIRETQPTTHYDGKDAVGTIFGETVGKLGDNDEIVDILMPAKGEGIEYNFGELKPGELSGYVYYDANQNKVKDSGEEGLSGVTVTLEILNEETGSYEKTDRAVATDANGRYVFDKLEPKRIYRLIETQPSGYTHTGEAVGTLGGESETYKLFDISVGIGDVGEEYDFGEYIPKDEPYIPPYTPPTSPVTPGTNLWSASPTTFPYIYYQPSIAGSTTNLYGGGGLPSAYSWRLSVLNGGQPRSLDALTSTYGFRGKYNFGDGGSNFANVSWTPADGVTGGRWLLRGPNGDTIGDYEFGAEDALPIVGDWNGDGVDYVGIFVDGKWLLDLNGDGVWDSDDLWAELGEKDDQPVSGDWDGDGKADIGIFGPQWSSDPLAISVEPGLPTDLNRNVSTERPKNLPPSEELFARAELNFRATKRRDSGQVRLDLIDHVFEYGNDGDVALTGDWTGDGVTKIGVYRSGDWYFDMNGDGRWDENDVKLEKLGDAGYQPLVGDFNGDGIDTIALFRDGVWSIDTDGDRRFDQTIRYGEAGDRAVVGDWNGDGIDELGVYRPSATSYDANDPNRQASDGDSTAPRTAQSAEVATLQR